MGLVDRWIRRPPALTVAPRVRNVARDAVASDSEIGDSEIGDSEIGDSEIGDADSLLPRLGASR